MSSLCPLPVFSLLGLNDLESVEDFDVDRANGSVNIAQGLQLETHRDARFPGTRSIYVEGFLDDRRWRGHFRILRRWCSESGHHEKCADYCQFVHIDSLKTSGQRKDRRNQTNYSNLSKLFSFTSSPLPLLLSSPFSVSCTLTLERVRRSYRHCPKESRLLPFILVAKGARVRFWNFDGPHRVAPVGLQSIRAIGSSSGGHSVRVVCVSRWRACTPPILLHWFFSPVPVCAYLLKSFVYTTGVLTPDKSALCVYSKRTHMRAWECERERREREKMRERWCVPTHHLPFFRTRSEHDWIERDVPTRVKGTKSTDTKR